MDRLARSGARGRQAILRWLKKLKPFEDIIACLLGLTVGITVGAVLVTGYSGHSTASPLHRHHASAVGSAALASPAAWARLAGWPTTPISPSFAA